MLQIKRTPGNSERARAFSAFSQSDSRTAFRQYVPWMVFGIFRQRLVIDPCVSHQLAQEDQGWLRRGLALDLGIHLLQTSVPLDVGGYFPFRQSDGGIGSEVRERRMQCRCRRQLITEDLIEDPEDAMDLDLAGFS